MRRKTTQISYKKDPAKYDLVVIGTPVWGWNITPPVRTYLQENKDKFKKVAFFKTCGDSKNKTFPDMEAESQSPLATLCVLDKEVKTKISQEKVEEFCEKFK